MSATTRRSFGMATFAGAFVCLPFAACSRPTDLQVSEAIYRPPLGSGTVGAAYFTIKSSEADALVQVTSSLAATVEIHETIVENSTASMRHVQRLQLPAGQAVTFAPGGLHLMVIDPYPLEGRTAFPLTLQFESGRSLTVECAIPVD